MVDFTNFGQVISYQAKLLKHMEHNDPDRIKDYLCAGFSSVEPTSIEDHPCGDIIKKAVDILVKNGWKIGFGDWKTIGRQLICISPEGKYYHSRFTH